MNTPYTIQQVDRSTWSHLVPQFSDYNYRQSWDFGTACAARVGALSEHVTIECPLRKTVIALADVRVRKIPVINSGIAYINGGPLVCKKTLPEQTTYLAAIYALVEEYVMRRKLTLRVAPPIVEDNGKNRFENVFHQMGFEQMSPTKKTILLDLSEEEESIRKNFHQKWRNGLNKSEKFGLKVLEGNDFLTFQQFIPLFNELIREKKFSVDLDINFYANVQNLAVNKEKFVISLVEYEGKPIAGHVASILGNTCVYLLGAADNTGRKMNAAYLLQWHAIKMSKAAGCRWYDLGGIDSEKNPGVYTFKKRMGGQERVFPGPYQMRPGGAKAILTQFGEKLYNTMKPLLLKL